MGTQRQFGNGDKDFRGTLVNTMKVGEFVPGTRPRRWNCVCSQCGVGGQTFSQHELVNQSARCRNSGCGRLHITEAAGDTLAKFRAREDEASQAAQRHHEELQAAAVEAAKSQLAETTRKIGVEVRLRLRKGVDDGLARDSEADGLSLSADDASRYNSAELRKFRTERPDAYLSDSNIETLGSYFERQGLRLISAKVLSAAYDRLSEYGLLEQRSAPVAKPTPPVEQSLARHPEPAPHEQPETYAGLDPATGQPCTYTAFQVSQMDAATFRKLCMRRTDLVLPFRALY